MQVTFKILRQSPTSSQNFQEYTLEVESRKTILDCLNQIKWELDGTLAFRKNCRNTICGSCAIKINGTSALACQENVGKYVKDKTSAERKITLAPLGNLPLIKDLVVDMQNFWEHLETIIPYVQTQKSPEREFLQTPEERALLDQTSNCISCGACYSECNAKIVNPDFVGPHALAKAQRLLTDSRDLEKQERLNQYNEGLSGVWGCTRCYQCNTVCPVGVEPMDQIGRIKQQILKQPDLEETRTIRHRRVLIDLVKKGGWVDERKFGLLVVGNRFRDLQGLCSILPLGFRMLLSRKFPFTFHPSEGTEQVSALIESVQDSEKLT